MINPVLEQRELSGPRQLPPASPALMSCVPNSGFDSRDGGQENEAIPAIITALGLEALVAVAIFAAWGAVLMGMVSR